MKASKIGDQIPLINRQGRMALSTWLASIVSGSGTKKAAADAQDEVQPEPKNEFQSLRDDLSSMRPLAAPWSASEPPSSDPEDCRTWLLQETAALAEDPAAEPGLYQFAERLTETLNLPDLSLPPSPSLHIQLRRI